MLFDASRPVTRPLFFNRERELKELLESVRSLRRGAARYLALLGFRKTGKTSLLRQFMEDAEAFEDVIVLSVDCWHKKPTPRAFCLDYLVETLDSFLRKRFPETLSFSLGAHLGEEAKLLSAIAELRRLRIKALDQATDNLLALLKNDASGLLFSAVMNIPESLAAETQTYFTVILDEFQELQDLNLFKPVKEHLGDIFAFLRGQWQRQRRTNYIIAGSRISMMRGILTRERSPLFQHFKILEVGGLPQQDGEQLLRQLSAASNRPIPESLIKRTTEIVGTNPFYLQVMGRELCQCDVLDEDAFKVTVQETLFSPSGRLSLYFEDLVGHVVGSSARVEQVLVEVAKEPGTLSQLAARLNVGTGTLKSWIDRSADLVRASNGVYSIADPCLGLWLAGRSDRRAVLPPMVLGDEAEKLAARRLAEAGYELVYQSRASRGAFDLLAILGAHEVGVQVKKGAFPFYLSKEELNLMRHWAERLNWIPLLALVVEESVRFYRVTDLKARGQSVRIDTKTPSVENLLLL